MMEKPKRPKKMWCKSRDGIPYPSKAHLRYNWAMLEWEMHRRRRLLESLASGKRVEVVAVSRWPAKGKGDA